MFKVLVSYLKFHYGRAYAEGVRMIGLKDPALIYVGIPLAILWTLLPIVILMLLTAGIYLAFIWNVI